MVYQFVLFTFTFVFSFVFVFTVMAATDSVQAVSTISLQVRSQNVFASVKLASRVTRRCMYVVIDSMSSLDQAVAQSLACQTYALPLHNLSLLTTTSGFVGACSAGYWAHTVCLSLDSHSS